MSCYCSHAFWSFELMKFISVGGYSEESGRYRSGHITRIGRDYLYNPALLWVYFSFAIFRPAYK